MPCENELVCCPVELDEGEVSPLFTYDANTVVEPVEDDEEPHV